MSKNVIIPSDNDWTGNTSYFRDADGNRTGVPISELEKFNKETVDSGRKVEKIPTLKFSDRSGTDFYVPEDRVENFLYEKKADGQDVAEVREWQNDKGEKMPVTMWKDDEKNRASMRAAGFKPAEEWGEGDGVRTGDFINAVNHAFTHGEDWGVTRDPETGKVDWGESAAEIGERIGRGTAGAAAGVAMGTAGMIGDAALNSAALASRGLGSIAEGIGYLTGSETADEVGAALKGWQAPVRREVEKFKEGVRDSIVKDVMGEAITQGTKFGEELAKSGLGAAETYGEMALGLKGIGKLGKAAVPATFGVGGMESTLEDEQVAKTGKWTSTAVATAKGIADAFMGHVLGKITHAVGVRGASKPMAKTFGKALGIALGESVEGGAVMGGMEAVNQAARGIAGVEDQMVDAEGNPTNDPEKAVGYRQSNVQERVARAENALLHGTLMTLGLKAAELTPRLFYTGRGMTKAVSYDVEMARKQYAPQVMRVGEAARLMQEAGNPLPNKGAYADVKGVSTNGEVYFKDGSVYYPEIPDRDTSVTARDGRPGVRTIKGRGARVVVSDGTILDREGNVVGKIAGGQRLETNPETQTEAYVRATDPRAANQVTVFDRATGRAADLPQNLLEIAPKGYQDYSSWMAGGQKGPAPEMDAESVAFGHIVGRLRMGGDARHAAEMALGDIKAGRKTAREALDLLNQVDAEISGKELVQIRTADSADTPEMRAEMVTPPVVGRTIVEAKPRKNGELPRSTVDAAADLHELGKIGEIKPDTVDLTQVEDTGASSGARGDTGASSGARGDTGASSGARGEMAPEGTQANGETGPVFLRLNQKTGRYETVDGGKRIAAEKESGAKTIEAVVLREEDGWTPENAEAVKLVGNITSGNMGAKEMVEAFGKLGISEADAIEKGLIGTRRAPSGEMDGKWVEQELANGKRRAALRVSQEADADLKAAVTDENLMAIDAICQEINSKTWGEGWEAAQRVALNEFKDLGMAQQAKALEIMRKMAPFVQNGQVEWGELGEVARYYAANEKRLMSEGIWISGLPGFTLVKDAMAEDAVARMPVMDADGKLTSVEKKTGAEMRPVSDRADGTGTVETIAENREPGLEMKASGETNEGTVFGYARFPEMKVTVGGKAVSVTGIDAQDLMDSRTIYDRAKVIGRLAELAEATGSVLRFPRGTERAVNFLLDYYDSSIKLDAGTRAKAGRVLGLLEKSGLATDVVTDQAEFERALADSPNGQRLVADGLTYGWTDGSKVYLNPKFFGTRAGLNTKIHEFGHLAWAQVKTINPELYKRGMELAGQMKEQLAALRKSTGYDKYSEEKLKEEILVKLIGNRGEAELAKSVPEKMIAEVKAWIREVWQAFGGAMGISDLTEEKARNMTIEEIADAVRAEMMSGRKFGERAIGNARENRAAKLEMHEPSKANGEIAKDAKPVTDAEAASGEMTTVNAGDGKMYSIKSAKYDLTKSSMIDDLLEYGVWGHDVVSSRKEAKKFKASMEKLVSKIEKIVAKDAQMKFLLDIDDSLMDKENRPFKAWKPNSDPLYKISLDFSTLCKKRILTQFVIEKLQKQLYRDGTLVDKNGNAKVMSAEHQMAVRDMLLEYQKIDQGLQVACHLCYVEAARLKAPKQINRYLADPRRVMVAYFAKKNSGFDADIKKLQAKWKVQHGYEADTPKTKMSSKDATALNEFSTAKRQEYKPSAEEKKIIDQAVKLDPESYMSAENLTKLSAEHPDIFKGYTDFVRESTNSKSLETDVPYYYGDSVEAFSDKMRDKMNEQGTGFRHQSWSDFQMRHLLDTMVAVCDLAYRGAKMHAYTKVPDFAEIFGRTGMMINLSLIPKVDGRGFDPKEGMDYETAVRLRNKFPATCGTIAISMSNEHLLDLINDPNIDYVIPYHVSGLNKGLRKMVGIEGWKDFTKTQHEINEKTDKAADNGPEQSEWIVRDGKDGYDSMVKSANRYLEICTERGLKPKFADIPGLVKKVNGKWRLENENYWKLLIDHKMIDSSTGELLTQQPVRPEFKFGSDAKRKDGIDDIIDRNVAEYDPTQMEKAYQFVSDRIPEIGKRAAKLKREGAYDKLVGEYDAAAEKTGQENPLLNRPTIEFVDDRVRVANDEGMGELTNGALAASRELSTQPVTPIRQAGQMRRMSLPLSDLEWLRKKLTGNNVPAHVAKSLPGGAASASTRAGKLVIAADVFGIVDRTDMESQKALLKAHGFFRNEDPTWAAGQTPAAVGAERRRSEDQLANQLETLGNRRVNGQAGGEAAARGIYADELANIVMEMRHVPTGGTAGRIRTVGDGIRQALLNGSAGNVDAIRDEAGSFLDWAYGTPAAGATPTRDLPAEQLTSRMFGAFLVMPQEVANRAPRWSMEMANAITSDMRLLSAWQELSMRGVTDQSYGHLMSEVEKSLDRQTEETIAKLESQGREKIDAKTGAGRWKERLFVGFDDRMAPVYVRVNENAKLYRDNKMKLIRETTDPVLKAQLEQELARFEGTIGDRMNKMELSRLAFERGSFNEGRAYFMRELMLVNEMTERRGLTIEDMAMYLDLNRVIETQGRAASRGMTPRQAKLGLDAMQRRLGAAKWADMQRFAGEWWSIHDQEFLSDPRLRTAFGNAFVNYLETQTHYVTTKRTWSAEELADIETARAMARQSGVAGGDDVVGQMFKFAGGRFGGMGASEGLVSSRLVGSMADKKNVMAATWEKVDRAQEFLRRNQFVIDMRNALLAANVEGVRDVGRGNRELKEGPRYGMLNYMENGQKRTLVVPRQIADAFDRDPGTMTMLGGLRNFWRTNIIDRNPAYWNRNINRNIGSIEKNMPGMRESWLKTVLRPLGLGNVSDTVMTHLCRHVNPVAGLFGDATVFAQIPRAKRIADIIQDPSKWQQKLWEADAAGDVEQVTQMQADLTDALKILRTNMLVPLRVNNQGGSAGFVNDVLDSKAMKTISRIREEYDAKGRLRKAVDALNVFTKNQRQQQWEDDHAKIIAYLHDRMKFGSVRTEAESGRKVAENVSIGQGERSGKAKGLLQGTVATFFNMTEKGFKRFVNAHRDRPGEMTVKDAKVVLGSFLGNLVLTGVASAVIRKMYDEDEKKIMESPLASAYQYCEFCRRARKNFSNYVKENYNAIPLWTSPSGKTSIVLGMPWNDEDKQLAPIGRYMAEKIAAKMGISAADPSAVDTAVKAATVSLTPDNLALAGPEWTLLRDTVWAMFKDNPTDAFTGAKLYDKKLYENRGASAEMAAQFGWAMAKQVWNDMGGRIVLQADRNEIEGRGEEPAFVDAALRKLPVASPLIRSFIKVQTGGPDKWAKDLTAEEKKRLSLLGILKDEAAKKATDAGAWPDVDNAAFEKRMSEWKKTYELTDDEEEKLRADIESDWLDPIDREIKEDEKRSTIEEKAERRGIDARYIVD